MNIFLLDEDPVLAAQMQCDKHCVKMIVETAQMLCTAHPSDIAPYKHTHFNHPCNVWLRSSRQNYEWLCTHGRALCAEYTLRYDRVHKTQSVIEWLTMNVPVALPALGLTPFAVAIKDMSLHRESVVESYRAYYLAEKRRFAKWKAVRGAPDWWVS